MKRTILFLAIVCTMINLLGRSVERTKTNQSQAASFSPEQESTILAATFQLQIYNTDEKYYEQGLATLVGLQDQTILVSHNHWGFLSACSKVIILDAESQHLLSLDCRVFKSLILYSSRGTLVLQAPKGLGGTPAELGTLENIHPGEPVLITHQHPSESSRLEVITGQIHVVDTFHQNPAVRLGIPDERVVRKGDSGGGIWVNGKLVGNLWAYKHELKTGQYFLEVVQTPIAAVIPWQAVQMVTDPGEVLTENFIEGSVKDKE